MDFLSRERDENKNDQKNLPRKVVDYCPKQDDHKQRTFKHRNKESGSKCTNHEDVFPKRSAKMIDGTEKPKIPFKFAQRAAGYNEFGYKKGFFWVFKTNLSIFRVISFYASWKIFIMARKFGMGFFGEINFGPAIFLGFDLCPHSIIPVT